MARRTIEKAVEQLRPHDHACLIYETREQQLAAAIPYIRTGLRRNEMCVYIADENSVDDVFLELKKAGVDIETALKRGQLQVTTSTGSYVVDGRFDVDRMMVFLDQGTQAALDAGFSAIRFTGEMSWVLTGNPGIDRLFEYEARINEFAADHLASGV
jgi:hypothetical protein